MLFPHALYKWKPDSVRGDNVLSEATRNMYYQVFWKETTAEVYAQRNLLEHTQVAWAFWPCVICPVGGRLDSERGQGFRALVFLSCHPWLCPASVNASGSLWQAAFLSRLLNIVFLVVFYSLLAPSE